MFNRGVLSNPGRHVYGLAGIALGVIGLVWGDFATVWQPIQALGNVPHREALAYIAAVCFLLGGATIQWRRTAQAGAVLLAILYFIFALFWVPRVIGYPRIFGTWGGFLQELSLLVSAAVVVYASLAPRASVQQPQARWRSGRTPYQAGHLRGTTRRHLRHVTNRVVVRPTPRVHSLPATFQGRECLYVTTGDRRAQ